MPEKAEPEALNLIGWIESIPFILIHLLPLGAIWSGFEWSDVAICFGLYYLRMFFITAGYHRYFSHRTFKTSRIGQFILALGGSLAVQKGAIWWAGHHRHHHRFSDTEHDVHSPLKGIWWSHVGWILCDAHKAPREDLMRDMMKFPELVWLDRHYWVTPALLGTVCYLIGGWGTFFIGFGLSTVFLYHGTFCVNSAAHIFGRRRYATSDTSRNSLLVALITCGEGWHNNHHHYQGSVKQGFFWWELDLTYYALAMLSWTGLVWDLRKPPSKALERDRIKDGAFDEGTFLARWNSMVASWETQRKQALGYYEMKRKGMQRFLETTQRTMERRFARMHAQSNSEDVSSFLQATQAKGRRVFISNRRNVRRYFAQKQEALKRMTETLNRKWGAMNEQQQKAYEEMLELLAEKQEELVRYLDSVQEEFQRMLMEGRRLAQA